MKVWVLVLRGKPNGRELSEGFQWRRQGDDGSRNKRSSGEGREGTDAEAPMMDGGETMDGLIAMPRGAPVMTP